MRLPQRRAQRQRRIPRDSGGSGKPTLDWRSWADGVDRVLLPVALACLCMLVVVQAVTAIPAVRRFVDERSGGFVQEPETTAAAVSRQAVLHLYLAPARPRPDVVVTVNGQARAVFDQPELTVTVHSGDVVGVRSGEPGVAFVQVDHADDHLLLPAPGQTLEIDQPGVVVSFPAVEFVP
ncbi:hypothetical protein [Alicyclobacillus sp.]|uniref:hypothetical protein n=1 Tax=Alicyclobacillus sp. TaxID=61169 RepID=UPI0025C1B6B9|nr:hypothetical protein [Alicyclobacillus sp.]MCL6515587.1 hypothetical protein [Alicyclobacillus sp.]